MIGKDYSSNKQIAVLLRQVAAALEVKGKSLFRIRAYERAAAAIEQAGVEVKDLLNEGKLTDLAGVGPSIAQYLEELLTTGKVSHFEKIKQNLPPAGFIFLTVPGIGPKTAFKLSRQLKITAAAGALKRLEQAAKKGRIRTIEGFGQKSEKEILSGLGRTRKTGRQQRMLLSFAWQQAKDLIDYLSVEKAVLRIDALGSLRRKTATVGDIDLAVASKNADRVMNRVRRYPRIKTILAAGPGTTRCLLQSGKQFDLKIVNPESYGALLQHYTGSKEHNIRLREIAKEKGLSLSEYGIKSAGRLKHFRQEKAFYQALKMAYIPPELRENSGEIEAAIRQFQKTPNGLPKLIKETDIKGDLHIHSSFDIEPNHDLGQDQFEIILQQAKALNYEYIGFSEHNPSLSRHRQSQIINLIKTKRQKIDELNYSRGKKLFIKVLNGLEIDIKPDGNLALPPAAFDYLDYAIAAIHTNFNMSRKKMTDRVIQGLAHPKVKFLAHPTTRKLTEREGIKLDWDRLFAFCKKESKFLEISASPQRLDLPDFLVRQAVENGVKMIINSDAHAVFQLKLMPYGVAVARRGWAQKNDIINSNSWDQFRKIFIEN